MRIRLIAPLIAALALVAPACGGGDDEAATTTTKRTTTTTAPVPVAFTPLTGEALFETGIAERPAVLVKVDNSPQGRPQSGLDKADVIFEERVEGGTTRFIAVFHSTDAESVGPIRSVRSTDPPIAHPFGGVFTYSGGIPAFDRLAKALPATTVTESNHSNAFDYRNDRKRPFKTYAATAKLRSFAADGAAPPPALATFLPEGQPFAPAVSEPAFSVNVSFGSRTTSTFDYDADKQRWARATNGTPHVVAGGDQLSVTNVIVQFVSYRNTGQRDASKNQVDEAVVVGSGDAWIFSGGKLVKGRWSKPDQAAMTTFTDAAGAPISLPAGNTWIGLPPVGSSVSVAATPPTTTTTAGATSSTSTTKR